MPATLSARFLGKHRCGASCVSRRAPRLEAPLLRRSRAVLRLHHRGTTPRPYSPSPCSRSQSRMRTCPCPPLLVAEVIEVPGERLEVLLQTRPGPGLRREPPLVPGRCQRLLSLFSCVLHRVPAHVAQGTSALLFRPEQHGIPPRIVGGLAPDVPEPLLVLRIPPERASQGAGLLHALLAHATELP